ncbi:hypothetical protein GC207_08740 [bacterium]|nr:hypothetical protein [bacterium]
MKNSSKPSNSNSIPDRFREQLPAYGLDLPVAPDWFSEEPKGTWEDGYQLSLQLIRDLKVRDRVLAERDACMVSAEFKM